MSFTLPALPYDFNALEPNISARTLEFHHGKHHQAYVNNLNKLVLDTPMQNHSLEEIIKISAQKPEMAGIFNNAAQVWNHTFYWNCMSPNGGGAPKAKTKQLIDECFGDFSNFENEFKQAAVTQFGSGWAWLVFENGTLKVTKTSNADCPMTKGQTALLTCDVWEHAYYLDYQNRRPDYVENFFTALVNWDFVEQNLTNASAYSNSNSKSGAL